MALLEQLPEPLRSRLAELPCPEFENTPWSVGPPLNQRRVAIISTAGLNRRGDEPFTGFSGEYRVIPGEVQANDLVMSHISTNFDRSGFQQDWNVIFPLDRLRELVQENFIASIASYHYSFMGATDPTQMKEAAAEVAGLLKKDRVDAVLLVPV